MSNSPAIDPSDRYARLNLQGQVAIVTGGYGGIGHATARSLSKRGCRVVITGRNPQRVEQAVTETPGSIGFPNCDVSDSRRVKELFRFALDRFGTVDILVTSAGIGRSPRSTRMIPDIVANLPTEEWDDMIDVNLRGAYLANREAARIMVPQKRGQILNVGSTRASRRGWAYTAGYSAAKCALLVMTQSLADELRPHGIRVTIAHPDLTDTPLISGPNIVGAVMAPYRVGEWIAGLLDQPIDTVYDEARLCPFSTGATPAAGGST
jgi:NAD(P)-dependent dehydrogenase (short-subunit alcohol dehydrogenase family)